jgi:hypothetical protein
MELQRLPGGSLIVWMAGTGDHDDRRGREQFLRHALRDHVLRAGQHRNRGGRQVGL